MSAGPFVFEAYLANGGGLFRIRVQPETSTLTIGGVANSPAAGPIPPGTRQALVSVGKRRQGIKIARAVGIKFNTGAAPTGYKPDSPYYLPWFDPTSYEAISRGDVVQYLGGSGVVVGKSPERGE